MDKFVAYTQYLVIVLYAFNTLAYLYLKNPNKVMYWFGAVLLAISVLRMR